MNNFNFFKEYKIMKKIISLLLVVCILFVSMPMAFATDFAQIKETCDDPVVYIAGDSGALYYDNDTKKFCIDQASNLLKDSEGDQSSKIYEATANILLPFILEGIAFNKWDNYYAAVEKEIGELFAPIRLDENGNVPEDSDCGIGKEAQADKIRKMTTDFADENGKYREETYLYNYDWRLDPIELADDLHEYIEGVKKATGHDKISIVCKCLGTNVVLAYVNKYGTDSLKGIGIGVSTSNGADFLSGAISGDFTIDGAGAVRLGKELATTKNFTIHPLILATIELLENSGVLDTLTTVARELLYAKIEYGIISALATSTMMTFPCYWALVTPEDFEDGLDYAFGKYGSEKRQKYTGLIEKITVYNETIKKHTYEIMEKIKTPDKDGNSTNLIIVSKYGTQMVPVIKDEEGMLADNYVSVEKSSFGATTSTIYDTLSDEYIANRVAEGLGKYISPDKKIDASTCLFPDYTWFIKNCEHGYYPYEERRLVLAVIDAETQLTPNDFEYSQFSIFDYPTDKISKMTDQNCDIEYWKPDRELEQPQTAAQRLVSFLRSVLNWFKVLFQSLTKKNG